jgi:hypothetical protein
MQTSNLSSVTRPLYIVETANLGIFLVNRGAQYTTRLVSKWGSSVPFFTGTLYYKIRSPNYLYEILRPFVDQFVKQW